ncbi:MAG: hypothetical protein IKJ35_09230 [Clostridia bacterium]|nr:hypothetical protein [Clostridia bacterium]
MKKNRLLSLLLALVMIVGTLAILPVHAIPDAEIPEGLILPAGEGTKEKPFLIANKGNLLWLSYMTSNYQEANEALNHTFTSDQVFKDCYFVQTADIDLGGDSFTPIGYTQANSASKRNAFAGHYDGRHYKISNATILESAKPGSIEYDTFMERGYHPGGIFGVLAAGASVSNVNACNIKVGTFNNTKKTASGAFNLTVAGVIVGTTYGNATIKGCTTDEDCEAYAAFAAGGILGMPEMSATISQCINAATVAAEKATGGIVGYGYNTTVSYCVNRGTLKHYTFTRWSGVGGIMGAPFGASSENVYVSIDHCVNAADAKIGATTMQPSGSGNNRVAVGGIIGNDDASRSASISYSYCYNLQNNFEIAYVANGNEGANNQLTALGGIAGYVKITASAGVRDFNHCDSVKVSYTNNEYGTKKTFEADYNPLSNVKNTAIHAGLVCGVLSEAQTTTGFGVPVTDVFATSQYGVAASVIEADENYRDIISVTGLIENYKIAPKYVGVQETLVKTADEYAVRFLVGIDGSDYYKAGLKVVASFGDGQTESFTLIADKYFDTVVGMSNGNAVPYSAASLGANKIMPLSLPIDLSTHGAVTYSVTPFSAKAAGDETAEGRTWTVRYDEDGFFAGQAIVEEDLVSDNTAKYTIVYPEDSIRAAVYPAVSLQYQIFAMRNIKLPFAGEESADPDAYEIVIREDSTMDAGSYKMEVVGNRLIVTSADMFGHIAASNRLTKRMFISGSITLDESHNCEGVYEREILGEKTAENRVIFQNVWFRHYTYQFNSVTSYQYQLALVVEYQPDVIGFNEFQEGWRNSGFIEAMAEIGYVEAKPTKDGKPVDNMGDPIFYNTNTTELIEGSSRYCSYGTYKSVDTDGDGIREAVKRNTGEFAGRYYDNADYRWMSGNVSSFRNKTTGEEYSVCCTHLESNSALDPQLAPLGNALRMEQIEKLIPFLDAYQAEFGNVILIGGDYNSADSYDYKKGGYSAKGDSNPWYFDWADQRNNHKDGYAEDWDDHKTNPNKALTVYDWHDGTQKEYLWGACDELRANGFINCREQTRDTAHNNSCNGYPTWNEDLMAFVGFSANLSDSASNSAYAGSIDHIYAREATEGELETVRYRNLSPETILSSSDHKPVLIDFNLNEAAE